MSARASKLQWQHHKAMQNLEEEALEEEKHGHQSFLWACEAALQACPSDHSSKTDVSPPSVNGKSIPPQTSDSDFSLYHKVEESCYLPLLHPSRSATMVPSPRAKWH